MALASTFKVEVNGGGVFGHAFTTITGAVMKILQKLDPNVKVNEYHFARLGYRAEFYGTPVHFDVIDNIQVKISRTLKADLENWKYTIIISYREAG